MNANEARKENVMKYGVTMRGGSIGERIGRYSKKGRLIVAEFATKEEAQEKARRLRKLLSPGEKKYYGIGYSVEAL